jgi:hypothetical protein
MEPDDAPLHGLAEEPGEDNLNAASAHHGHRDAAAVR